MLELIFLAVWFQEIFDSFFSRMKIINKKITVVDICNLLDIIIPSIEEYIGYKICFDIVLYVVVMVVSYPYFPP